MTAAIIVNWNGKHLLLEAIDSLTAAQSGAIKIIVVDNGSSDGSVEAVRARYYDLDLILNSRNLGFAKANNQGIQRAVELGAKRIFFLNNDAAVAPTCLEILERFLDQHPVAAAVAPVILYSDGENRIWFGGGRVWLGLGYIAHRRIRRRLDPDWKTPERCGYLTGCAFLARTEALSQTGGFDLAFGHYSEDVDLSLRLRRLGWELWMDPRAIAYHRVSASAGGELVPFKGFHRSRSNVRLLLRHAKWHHLPTVIISGLLISAAVTIRLIFAGKAATAAAVWHGIISGIMDGKIPKAFRLDS